MGLDVHLLQLNEIGLILLHWARFRTKTITTTATTTKLPQILSEDEKVETKIAMQMKMEVIDKEDNDEEDENEDDDDEDEYYIPKELMAMIYEYYYYYQSEWSMEFKNAKYQISKTDNYRQILLGGPGTGLIRCTHALPWKRLSIWYLQLGGSYNLADFYGVIADLIPQTQFQIPTHPYNTNNRQNLYCYGILFDRKELIINNHSMIIKEEDWYQPRLKAGDVIQLECDLRNRQKPTLTVRLRDHCENIKKEDEGGGRRGGGGGRREGEDLDRREINQPFGFAKRGYTMELPTDRLYQWYPCVGTYSSSRITLAFDDILRAEEEEQHEAPPVYI